MFEDAYKSIKSKVTEEEMRGVEVEMGLADAAGTSYAGEFPKGTDFVDLSEVFGEPKYPAGGDGKIQAMWRGTIDGEVFTIYDYKQDVEPPDVDDWHIGGKSKHPNNLVAKVIAYFEQKLGDGETPEPESADEKAVEKGGEKIKEIWDDDTEEPPAYFKKEFQITLTGMDLFDLRWSVIDNHDLSEAVVIAQKILDQIPEDIKNEIGESEHE